jgi:DNA replication protein DnaC
MDIVTRIKEIAARHPRTPDVQPIGRTVSAEVKSVPFPSSESERQAEAERLARVASRQAEIAAMERYSAARVPLRYRETKTEVRHPEWATAYDTVRACVATRGAIVVVTGEHGTGKTHLACEVIRWACWHDMTARYETWPDIARRWREAITSDQGDSERSVVSDLDRAALLAIDEIDIGKDGDFGDRSMRELLDRRYRNLKSTILLSNLSAEALGKKLDPSVLSRIQETGGIVVCDWPSFRSRGVA